MLTSGHVLYGGGAHEQQPVFLLGSDLPRRVGRTRHGRLGIVQHDERAVHVDCATAEIDLALAEARDFAVCTPGTAPVVGQGVMMLGAATRGTHGVIADTNYSGAALVEGRDRPVQGQLLVRALGSGARFSDDGDSGATLRNSDGAVIGIVWGTTAAGEALACPIDPVLWLLDVALARSLIPGDVE
jgi:hypothetical protein